MDKKKLFLTERDMDVFRVLMKYHLTGKMVFGLSRTFKNPFTNVANTRARLGQLYGAGFLNRDERLLKGRGNNQNYYFLTAKSASLLEELEGVSKKHSIFRPIKVGIQAHCFLLSEIMVKMALDIHQFRDICQMLGFIRENNFVVKGYGKRFIKPDGTIFVNINGENKLFFLEVDLSTETVSSANTDTRTFRKKLEIYSEFKKYSFHQDEVIHRFRGIDGYRVLIVCRTFQRHQNLLNLANSMNKSGMFWFATAKTILDKDYNCLFDRIWTLPNGQFYSLF